MREIGLALVVIFIMSACGNDSGNKGNTLFDKDPTEENYVTLMNDLMAVIRNDNSTLEERMNALNQGYEASITMKKTPQAIGFLNTSIKEDFKAEDTPDKLLSLSSLLKEAGKPQVAETIAQGFLYSFPNHAKAAEAKAFVSDDAPDIEARIEKLGNAMFDMEAGKLNEDVARSFVDICEAYALSAPSNKDVPDYLHKAAETARTMRTLPKAISLYDWILEDYPDHPKAPQALFLKAFTYDNNLDDTTSARLYYTEFLKKYPNDDFADDSQFLLDNLGKSDEEMLEALTKKK